MRLNAIVILFALASGLVSALQAAVVVQYSSVLAPEDGSLPTPAAYSTGMSLASPLVGSNDSVERRDGSLNFGGWGSRYTLDKYVSFTVTTEPGFEATLTHISFKSFGDEGVGLRNPAPGITSFTLAYRVDGGTWSFGETYYTIPRGEIVWDFQDIQTTGIVEFALFATADFPGADLSIDTLNLYGHVPEPSVAILAGLSSAAALRRRRRN